MLVMYEECGKIFATVIILLQMANYKDTSVTENPCYAHHIPL